MRISVCGHFHTPTSSCGPFFSRSMNKFRSLNLYNGGEKERETDRQRARDRQIDRQRGRERKKGRKRERERERRSGHYLRETIEKKMSMSRFFPGSSPDMVHTCPLEET